MSKHAPRANPLILAAAVLGGVLLAIHIYLHLGDYTAERGVTAFAQVAATSVAFGALVLLVLETARHVLEKVFPRDQSPRS